MMGAGGVVTHWLPTAHGCKYGAGEREGVGLTGSPLHGVVNMEKGRRRGCW